MGVVKGFFQEGRNDPYVNLTLKNPQNDKSLNVHAVIDTGFTGFIQIPLMFVALLNVPILSSLVSSVTLADGSTRQYSLTEVCASIEDEFICNLALISPQGSDVLIGMEFLRLDDRALLVYQDSIFLAKKPDISTTLLP